MVAIFCMNPVEKFVASSNRKFEAVFASPNRKQSLGAPVEISSVAVIFL